MRGTGQWSQAITSTDRGGNFYSSHGTVDILTKQRAFFTSSSLFTDLGFTLTPDSMMSFKTATFLLIFGSFLIIIGNTGFPCMLRFMTWLGSKVIHVDGRLYEELRFLLDHPRRSFTLLFPSSATWWLFWTLMIFNGVDLIFFIILDVSFFPLSVFTV